MLKITAIIPDSPFLIEKIGKENFTKLKKTVQALNTLNKIFLEEKIDSIIIISHHANLLKNAFTIGYADFFKTNFENFGDYSIKNCYPIDHELINSLKYNSTSELPILLNYNKDLEYNIANPLHYLNKTNLPITPIGYSDLNYKQHFEFGKIIQRTTQLLNKRIGIIISTNFTSQEKNIKNKTTNNYVDIILKSIKKNDFNLLQTLITKNNIKNEPVLKLASILLGVLDSTKNITKKLNQENCCNIEYLTTYSKIITSTNSV